jgi:predicted permease
MFRNYLKIALRTLWKNRTHTLINLVGLSVAFGTCILLFLTTAFELSYDRFHADADRIYRLNFLDTKRDGTPDPSTTMPYPISPALRAEFPEVEGVSRWFDQSSSVRWQDRTFGEDVRRADADFLTMFSFPMLQGKASSAMQGINDIVISEKMAKAVFGSVSPMGKTLQLRLGDQWRPFTVTGIVGNMPENSSLQFDALISSQNQDDYQAYKDKWDHGSHSVFVKLKAGVTPAMLQNRMQALMNKYFAGDIAERTKQGYPKNELGFQRSLLLQPLTDVHFDITTGGNGTSRVYIYSLLAVGLFILIIACINFVNLTIAQSITRAREVGVRKSLGAQRGQLFGQIWGETVLLSGTALLLGLGTAYILLPTFNKLFRSNLSIQNFLTPNVLLVTVLSFLLITLVAGGYPSWFVTRFSAVEVLKGKVKISKPGILRNTLIITQFAIACLLIVCTLIMRQQVTYLQQRPMGLNKEQVISVPIGGELNGTTALRQMRDRLSSQPNIVAVTGSGVNVGSGLDGSSSRMMYGFTHGKREITCDWLRVDFDYLKTMDVKLKAGRDFNSAYSTDSTSAILVSESMAKQLGEANPVGKYIEPDSGKKYQIVGVFADFNLYSLRQKAEPMALQMLPDRSINYVLVRVNPQNLTGAMETVKAAWKEIDPKHEFIGSFVDENVERWYKKEKRLATIFSSAASIAILLSCMGLFAVALISIEQRTKEIGVRKVLGASVASIVTLLASDFLKLVLVAIVVASPLAWYAMNQWLSDFAYRIDMPWWVFILSGLLAVLIAFVTISFRSVKAALMNPVKSLRSE